ncbi:NTF2 fold immunity protein [Chryseolinea sp. T2]|uniref:NTF2 fold immunity protein n=1 Tax=Chryseolinea sp. T2 TaxID=3129255 RepID=UPI0030785230
MTRILIILSTTLLTIACTRTKPLDEGRAREILESALKDSTDVLTNTHTNLIDDEETAVNFAEAVLFNVYGKRHIENEMPYNVASVDGYWIITGTVHAQLGGAFEIVFNSRDGQIVRSTHYK